MAERYFKLEEFAIDHYTPNFDCNLDYRILSFDHNLSYNFSFSFDYEPGHNVHLKYTDYISRIQGRNSIV